ncbi:BgTH12-02979 [Blumeria graminis f. sp. triticale]|uniref:BgTH12-02979 n=1 Tax=Blumeria graminis f. sp. triticale TaxID=1689686 RepID=A0A9W4D7G4_BLUGR|nr:BgTH12-02979 [Blumeria graminis f. sp. triticale]
MRCLYAFLLIPREGLESTKRLAIVKAGPIGAYYDVFKPESDQYFPVVDSGTGIKTTQGDITGPGTYARAYCSHNLSRNNLIKHVTKGLKSAYDNTHMGLGGADKAAEDCLGLLENLSHQTEESSQKYVSPAGYTRLSSSDPSDPSDPSARKKKSRSLLGISSHWLEKPPKILLSKIHEMKVCSDLGLISLAYQKKIKITGLYRHFAPEHSKGGYEVEFDKLVDISNIVFPGQMMALFVHEAQLYAVAWYMGHLHVFVKDGSNSPWWPETFIGSEKISGDKITLFISNHYKVLNPVMRIVHEFKCYENNLECCFMNCFRGTKAFQQESNRLISDIASLNLKKIPEMNQAITV